MRLSYNIILCFCLFFLSFSNAAQNEKRINPQETSEQPNKKIYRLKIYDKYHLIKQKEITFSDKESLQQALKKLFAKLIDNGYVTSSISTKNGKITVLPGKVKNVELQDDSTFFINLKKTLFGMDLENKIFNVADVNQFVERYNKNKTNKLKVSVVNADEPYYSNIIVTNQYKFKIRPRLSYQYAHPTKSLYQKKDSHKYTVGATFEQILGFNDSLNLTAFLEKKDKTFLFNYHFPLKNSDIHLSYSFEKQKTDLTYGNVLYDKNYNLNLSLNQEIIKQPDLFMTFYASIGKEMEQEKIRQTLIYKRNIFSFDSALTIKKYLVHQQDIYTLLFSPNISYKVIQPKEPQQAKKSACLMALPQFSFNTPYYNGNIFGGYSKLISGDFLYDKCLFDNKITDFDNVPLHYKSSSVAYLDNTFKYPITLANTFVYPFFEIALGRDFKNKENLSGLSAGMIFSLKNLEIGTKFSGTKQEQAFTLKFSVKF